MQVVKLVAVISILALLLVAAGFAWVWSKSRQAVEAANHWFALIQTQHFDEALATAAPALQHTSNTDTLRQFALESGVSPSGTPAWTNREYFPKDGVVTLGGGYPLAAGGQAAIAISLRTLDGTWHVESVVWGADIVQKMRWHSDIQNLPPGLHNSGQDSGHSL